MPHCQLTGCIRQGKKSKMSVFCRCMGLSHLAVGFRHHLQCGLALAGSASHSAAQTLLQMAVIHAAFQGTGQVVPAASMFTLICVHLAHCVQSCSTFMRLFCLDHEIHNVPPDKENDHPLTHMHWQNLHLDSWTEQEAYGFTSFTKDQLNNIYHHFGLAALAAQNDGDIPVPTGADHGRNYHVHPDELFFVYDDEV
jgi:hypothetical protein